MNSKSTPESSPLEEPVLTTLQYALFVPNPDHRTLRLVGNEPQWVRSTFGSLWDSEASQLCIPQHSALDSFVNDVLERIEIGDEKAHGASIVFEEISPGKNHLVGRVTSCVLASAEAPIFAIRPLDDLDSIARTEVQLLRSTALQASPFGNIKRRSCSGNAFETNHIAETFLQLAISSSEEGFLILGSEGEFLMANRAARSLFPDLPAVRNQKTEQPDPAWNLLFRRTLSRNTIRPLSLALQKGIQEPIETTWELPLPFPHTSEVRIIPVRSACGVQLAGTIWLFRNQKRETDLLSQINESDRLEAVGRLAGGVAHDFNNLLAIVMGNLALLQETAIEQNVCEVNGKAELAMQAANKAAAMVKQLLGYSRMSQLDQEVIGVEKVIEDSLKLFRSTTAPGLKIDLDVDFDGWNIHADREKLGHVFLNILKNAARATDGEGQIVISGRTHILDDPGMARAMDCNLGHYLVINITDDGIGMTDETRERVFEPFFTTKETGQGTGLGLANSLGIIRQHGGHLSCTSIAGEGTTFTIFLPRERTLANRQKLREAASQREQVLNREAAEDRQTPAILVVDDEELLRNVVRTMLHRNGFRTFGAGNGREALELIEENNSKISAIILDLAMPEMTGNELFKLLNESGSTIPVIVASGYLVDTEKFIRESGKRPAAFFSKPYQLGDLLRQVRLETSGMQSPG